MMDERLAVALLIGAAVVYALPVSERQSAVTPTPAPTAAPTPAPAAPEPAVHPEPTMAPKITPAPTMPSPAPVAVSTSVLPTSPPLEPVAFCADPAGLMFDGSGCADPSSRASCVSTVHDGWVADDSLCGPVLTKRLGDLNCIVDGQDMCQRPLVCTLDPVGMGAFKCMHGYESRQLGQSCLPFGESGMEHHSCARGYCARMPSGAAYECALFDWGESRGGSGCRRDADCVEGLACSGHGVCYKPARSVGTGGSCKLDGECASARCKNVGGATGYCEPPGTSASGQMCWYDAECASGSCRSGACL